MHENKSPIFENELMIVKKIYVDIGTGNIIKRVSKVIWKSVGDTPYFDIRTYNKKKNEYYKGISFKIDEIDDVKMQ